MQWYRSLFLPAWKTKTNLVVVKIKLQIGSDRFVIVDLRNLKFWDSKSKLSDTEGKTHASKVEWLGKNNNKRLKIKRVKERVISIWLKVMG